mgnify:CR=1 FL=1
MLRKNTNIFAESLFLNIMYEGIRKRGNIAEKAEEKFKEWLDTHEIPYLYIDQSYKTFSKGLQRIFAKRPDFLVLVKPFGFIIVDVKNREPKRGKIFIDEEETHKYLQLERLINMRVWYAISSESHGYDLWFWIPASKVIEVGERKRRRSDKKPFYIVSLNDFIHIKSDEKDPLTLLFKQF